MKKRAQPRRRLTSSAPKASTKTGENAAQATTAAQSAKAGTLPAPQAHTVQARPALNTAREENAPTPPKARSGAPSRYQDMLVEEIFRRVWQSQKAPMAGAARKAGRPAKSESESALLVTVAKKYGTVDGDRFTLSPGHGWSDVLTELQQHGLKFQFVDAARQAVRRALRKR